jgi:hypothetical protein
VEYANKTALQQRNLTITIPETPAKLHDNYNRFINHIAAVNSEKAGKQKTHDWVPFFQIVAKGLLYISHLLSIAYENTKSFELRKIGGVFWFHFQYMGDPEWLVDLKAQVDGPKNLRANAPSSSSTQGSLPQGSLPQGSPSQGLPQGSPMSTGPTKPNPPIATKYMSPMSPMSTSPTESTTKAMSWEPYNKEQLVLGGRRKAKRGGANLFGQTIHIPWYETMKPAPIPDGKLHQIMKDNIAADLAQPPIRPPARDAMDQPQFDHELMIPLETLEKIFGDKAENPVQQCNSQLQGLKVAGKKKAKRRPQSKKNKNKKATKK